MKKYIGIKSIQAEPQDRDGQPGYKVVYEDGYISWSPKDVFDKTYISDQTMSFGFALEAMKMGFKVKRPNMVDGDYLEFKEDKAEMRSMDTNLIDWSELTHEDIHALDWMIDRVEEEVKETTE
jgi:hypothetical protein